VAKTRKDDFGFKSFKSIDSFKNVNRVQGPDTKADLNRPLSLERRYRPALNTKDFSVTSDYDYASLWCRWRRGYELAMYGQEAYDGLSYSFKYYISNNPPFGQFLPGMCFMYPSTRTDMRMHMVAIRPRDSFNFLNFGYQIAAVTQYDGDIYAVRLNERFGAPISFFAGEVVSNRFNANGTEKQYGYNNYTITGVGFNGVPKTPSFRPEFNTLFIAVDKERSWSVVDANTLAVPASGLPAVGEYFSTEMRFQCTCQDFLAREGFNLYDASLRRKYPYTKTQNLDPGTYLAGNMQTPRVSDSADDPGYVRTFGFIYINEIYNTPRYEEMTYSDSNFYYYYPKWCKHIYAAFWDMQLKYNQTAMTSSWLPQPVDEPLNEYYREYFDKQLAKQTSFLKRERDLRWWQRYSPAKDDMPVHMMYPDMYNMMEKSLNFGRGITELTSNGFLMFTLDEYDPFAPSISYATGYDNGTYANGIQISPPTNILDGGQYKNGVLIPPATIPSAINGGTY
jgi:hypothetical protein